MSELGNRRVVKLSDLSAASSTKPPVEEESFESMLAEATEEIPSEEVTENVAEISATEATAAEAELPENLAEDIPTEPAEMQIEEQHESLADALAALQKEREEKKVEEEKIAFENVSDEIGIIASGTRVLGDIVTDGHLEIYGTVQGSINARGNVLVKGDVYGDISCGNLIINEGVLKINVQAREDISLGEKARIEGDVRCRKIGVQGYVVGNVTATELVQIAGTATVNGNITTGGISIGMGAVVNGSIKTIV